MSASLLDQVPAFALLRSYTAGDLRRDLIGGLSVAAVAVPQAMAYALIAGLPPEMGLYTAIVMTAVGAVFASSRQLINGPTNAISIALLSALGSLVTPEDKVQGAIAMAMLVGVLQLTLALLRLGDLTRFISHSVIVGFTAGASVLLLLDQLKNLFGQKAVGDPHDHFLLRFWNSLTAGGPVHGPTLAVGLSAMALVLLIRLAKTKLNTPLFPELLVVVVAAGFATWGLGLEQLGVRVVGDIPAHLPAFAIPQFNYAWVQENAGTALALGLLGLLEAVSMSKALASANHEKLDLNQQVLSEGLANIAGSLFGCMPGSGSLTRSAINQQAGARTQWSGVISAIAVALIMLVFAPYARFIPRSALAGILMLTAAKMVNLRELRYYVRTSRFDAVIVASTAIAAFAISIEFCVMIGVILSFFLAIPRISNPLLTEFVPGDNDIVHERLPSDLPCSQILIFGLEGEFFFGSSGAIDAHFETIESRITPEVKVVVLRLKRARNPDAVCLHQLEQFCLRLKERGVDVLLCGVRTPMKDALDRSGLTHKIGAANIFEEQPIRQTSTQLAMRAAYTRIQRPCGHCPGAPRS